jgi:hypothetical protein
MDLPIHLALSSSSFVVLGIEHQDFMHAKNMLYTELLPQPCSFPSNLFPLFFLVGVGDVLLCCPG